MGTSSLIAHSIDSLSEEDGTDRHVAYSSFSY